MELIERFFDIKKRNSTIKTEVIAGITTFLAMSYVMMVTPAILSEAGMPKEPLVVATCLASAFGTLITGLIANTPLALAPGMVLSTFFAYTLVLDRKISWETALGIVFLSGLLFLIFSFKGKRIVQAIPKSVASATSVGIGLFISFIGLRSMGLVVAHPATLVKIGALKGEVLIGILGILLIIVLESKKIRGAIPIGIIFSTVLGILTGFVRLPSQWTNTSFDITPILFKLDIVGALRWSFLGVILAMAFIDMFDSIGTIMACSKEANLVNEDGSVKKMKTMLILDSIATMVGAFLGTSTTTTFIESAVGIREGGKTGLTSVVTGILFLLAVIFAPILSIFPGFATGPALVVVGMLMMQKVKDIDFSTIEEGFPSFITIIMMPLTSSIATGLAFGFISYVIIKFVKGQARYMDPVTFVISIVALINLIIR